MKPAGRFFRLLLRLYPREHRARYGEEILDAVAYRLRRGPGGPLPTLAAAADLAWSAVGVWARRLGRLGLGLSDGLALDVRFVLRSLWRSPSYTATVVLVLAAAVAVNATVFAFVRGTLLDTPSFPGDENLVVAWGSNPGDGQLRDVVSGPTFIDLARETRSLEALAAFHTDPAILERDGKPAVLSIHNVSVDFFRVVPVTPFLGRVFGEEDRTSSAPKTVVVSYGFWRDNLGSDPSWVGRALPVNGEPHTVIGVLPEGFEFVQPVPLWGPLRDDELAADSRYRIHYHLFGRLRPGATAPEATRDLSGIMARISDEYPGFQGWSVLAERWHDAEVLAVRPVLWTVSAAVVLVLLIALVNLATLYRIRTLRRTDELAVRMAVGGGAAQVARVLALESVGMAVTSAALGLAAAPVMLAWVRGMVPERIVIPESAAQVPVLQAVLDPWVMGAAAVLAVTGAAALNAPALVHALRSTRSAWGGRAAGGARGIRWLVMAELALATVLCLGAALTTRSAQKLLATDMGLEDEGLLSLYFGNVWERPIPEQVTYFRQVVEAVEAVPGVTGVGLLDYIPFEGEDDYARITFLDRASQPIRDIREEWRRVSAGLFATAGMRVLRGRAFTEDDLRGPARVAVVNESFARKHYPQGEAVGQRLSTHDDGYKDLEIVGVVADVRSNGPAVAPPPLLYVPLQGSPRGTTGMYVRVASGDGMAVAGTVRDAIWSVDSSQPVMSMRPMSQLVSAWVAIPRTTRRLVAALAALALVLSAVGVFGVVAFAVRARLREWGVRLALGASPRRLERDVVRDQVPMVILGIVAGLVVGALAARGASAVLYGVDPLDPGSLVVALVVMGAAALGAVYLPARRIGKVDPTVVIRSDSGH